jgi:hypothetical protein
MGSLTVLLSASRALTRFGCHCQYSGRVLLYNGEDAMDDGAGQEKKSARLSLKNNRYSPAGWVSHPAQPIRARSFGLRLPKTGAAHRVYPVARDITLYPLDAVLS